MRLQRDEPADQPKAEFLFGGFDLKDAAFISIREAKGCGRGLPHIGKITLEEGEKDPSYKKTDYTLNQSYAILKILFP